MDADRSYLMRRAAQERAAAANARGEEARKVHETMARAYCKRLEANSQPTRVPA
jgi:hypothetical protein